MYDSGTFENSSPCRGIPLKARCVLVARGSGRVAAGAAQRPGRHKKGKENRALYRGKSSALFPERGYSRLCSGPASIERHTSTYPFLVVTVTPDPHGPAYLGGVLRGRFCAFRPSCRPSGEACALGVEVFRPAVLAHSTGDVESMRCLGLDRPRRV